MRSTDSQELMGWYVERSGVYEFVRGGNVRDGRNEPPTPSPQSDTQEEQRCSDGKTA